MGQYKDPRSGLWEYRKRFTWEGQRHNIQKGGFAKKSECADAEHRAVEAIKHPPAPAPPPALTFDTWFNGRYWTEWVVGGPKPSSPSEVEAKTLIYRKWLKPFFGELALDRIDLERVNTFRSHLRALKKADGSRQLSEKTVNNILAVLSKPLRYATDAGVILRAPKVGVTKVERPEKSYIDFEEVPAVFGAAAIEGEEWLIAVMLAFEAGLRVGEIRELEWSQVDMRAGTITVDKQVRLCRNQHSGAYEDVVGPPKGRKRRTIPMTPGLRAVLQDRLRVGYVVSGRKGARKTREEIRGVIERTFERAGLAAKASGWHVGRHTFGTHCALLGVNPWELQHWMGHADLKETQGYADVARAHGRAVPPAMLAAAEGIADPNQRVLAMLSARHGLLAGQKPDPSQIRAQARRGRPPKSR